MSATRRCRTTAGTAPAAARSGPLESSHPWVPRRPRPTRGRLVPRSVRDSPPSAGGTDGAGPPYVSGTDVHWSPVTFADGPAEAGRPRAWASPPTRFVVGVLLSLPVSVVLHALGEPGGRPVLLLVSARRAVARHRRRDRVRHRRPGNALAHDRLRAALQDGRHPVRRCRVDRRPASRRVLVLPIVAVWPNLEPPRSGNLRRRGARRGRMDRARARGVHWCAVHRGALLPRPRADTRLVGRLGALPGIAITSVLFGAAHLIGWVGPITIVYAVAITGAGFVFGLLRHLTGRLGPSMMAHCFLNAQALIVLALLD